MEPILQELDSKLHTWAPDFTAEVLSLIAAVIELCDKYAIDLSSRQRAKETLHLLHEPSAKKRMPKKLKSKFNERAGEVALPTPS